ncbi:MAG TPA: ACT domain-containing protein [Candidatus Bilamarchaeum sp.]|nr:ACT domain-containing protein [Candidatus Bilamarchaeum sp.]
MAEKDLERLLRGMDPALSEGKYWMGTFDESQMMALANYLSGILCIFREGEGLSVVFDEGVLEELGALSEKKAEGPFALITLNVKSDLLAVGFLARISSALAARSIPVNAVSAYFHDHLLVPYSMKDDAMTALGRLQAGH